MNTHEIAAEAAKQLHKTDYFHNVAIIQFAIEKATEWKDRELEGLRQQNEAYRLDNLRLRDQLRAAHASEK